MARGAWLLANVLFTAALKQCNEHSSTHEVYLSNYHAYNAELSKTSLEFWLDFESVRVRGNLSIDSYSGGDLVLNGSDFLQLEDILIQPIIDGEMSTQAKSIKNSVCLTNDHDLVLSEQDLPANTPFIIMVETSFNPSKNTQLFGLYRSRDMLVTQNESAGFRRILFYPDRPDVLSRFSVTMHAVADKFPVLLSNGNMRSSMLSDDGQLTVVYEDPYPKPSYLFALVAGDLVKKESVVTLGQSCAESAATLFPDDPVKSAQCQNYAGPNEDETFVSNEALATSHLNPIQHVLRRLERVPSQVGSFMSGASDAIHSRVGWLIRNLSGAHLMEVSENEAKDDDELEQIVLSYENGNHYAAVRENEHTTEIKNSRSSKSCFLDRTSASYEGVSKFRNSAKARLRKQGSCLYDVTIRIWGEAGHVEPDSLVWALDSVEKSMLYDQYRFDRYYDLDEFNVVTTHDFNAGAMENKGLNIFNEALLIADPSYTTDQQYDRIRSVIAHEYFHNWSGDRVTSTLR